MTVFRSALAIQDVWEAAAWFTEVEDAALALRFVDAIEEAVKQISAQPYLGPVARGLSGRLKGIRYWRVSRFPHHLVFYRVDEDVVTIIRILHGARKLDDLL
ncbi:MAG: type II toxin-antitoxin system RelE/ParE family toxin [Verrucomicrobiales bacterium]|nr:type II toxin-antitoxin system RelE/ParE family toxin [Verrucomicrobiales bacterium]